MFHFDFCKERVWSLRYLVDFPTPSCLLVHPSKVVPGPLPQAFHQAIHKPQILHGYNDQLTFLGHSVIFIGLESRDVALTSQAHDFHYE